MITPPPLDDGENHQGGRREIGGEEEAILPRVSPTDHRQKRGGGNAPTKHPQKPPQGEEMEARDRQTWQKGSKSTPQVTPLIPPPQQYYQMPQPHPPPYNSPKWTRQRSSQAY